jgi:hypothetical protein
VRAFKIVLIVTSLALVVLAGFIYFGPLGPASPYHRFHNQQRDYYSGLARACDTILKQHPNFTRHTEASKERRYLWFDENDVVWDMTRITPNDPSLPHAVQGLSPDEILLAPNRVFIGFGVGRVGWGIIWEQDDTQTNRWRLQTNGDGYVRVVYEETR